MTEGNDVVAEARVVESLLGGLEPEIRTNSAMDVFREIFEHWGFESEDEEVEREYLDDFVDENTGELKVISVARSRGLNFYVIYAETWKDTLKYRQKLVKNLLNFTSYSSDISFANFIIILDVIENPKSKKHKYWKLIIPIYQRKLESAKLNVYVIDPEEKKFRTLATNISKVALELRKHDTLSASLIRDALNNYMLVKPLAEEFFREYKRSYYDLKNWIKTRYGSELRALCPDDYLLTGESIEIPKAKREEIFVERASKTFAHTFFNRLMFVYFLQKKGWIVDLSTLRKELQDEVDLRNFVKWLHDQYEEYGGNFYGDYLRVLFLYAMNRPRRGYSRKDIEDINKVPSPIVRDVFLYGVPYFNGGLFSPVEIAGVNLDEVITEIDNKLITEIVMGFFEVYNFTVTEETPYEVEVAVDPAMLGKIYESLIAEEEQIESEEERRASGIFYTPRSEVDFMCRMAVYEYLERNTKLDKGLLRSFVFTPPYNWDPKSLSWNEIETLERALNEVRVVDPAAGSGAFLVGMYHLLIELHEKLTEDSKVTYKKKLEIIRDNIYGVDIKDWAIRVAKLRLWLALIEGEGTIPNEPILPNLETKLAVGDSLAPPHFVLRVGGKKKVIEIPLAKFRESLKLLWAKKGASEAIVAYKELVRKYYMGEKIDGKPVTLKDIEMAKWGALQEFLERALEEELKAKEKKEVRLLLEAVKKEDFSALEKPPFIWELDFPDVMLEKRGFDIVIANPPYVKSKKIYPEYHDLVEFQTLPLDLQKKLKKEYKNNIKKHMELVIREKFGKELSLNPNSDLYVYFFVQGVNLLNKAGTIVFITSNSWMDSEYGKPLQEFLLRVTHLRYLIDYSTRSFEQAEVNTSITIATRKPRELFNTVTDNAVKFILLKVPFSKIALDTIGTLFDSLECSDEFNVFNTRLCLWSNEEITIRWISEVDLAKLGGAKIGKKNPLLQAYNIHGNYHGVKWGTLLVRAPKITYRILGNDRVSWKYLEKDNIARVYEGRPTGANNFFYLQKETIREFGIEPQYLRPAIMKARELSRIIIEDKDIKRFLLCVSKPKSTLKETNVLKYIEYGEKKKINQRSTFASKKIWYALNCRKPSPLIMACGIGSTFICAYNKAEALTSNSFAEIDVISKEDIVPLWAYFNSTLGIFMIELYGKANMGGGMLKVDPNEYRQIPVLMVKNNKLGQILNKMANREIKSIFEELGLPKPNRDLSNINPEDVSLDRVMPDRRELDRVIFEALGLTEEEQLEVYKAVVELVKARLVKAKTFSKKKGKK
ncbi:hypothetical protein CL1_1062 [Thermococcus cleftensis]|uniref:site-specific DNA-methyltransferase (adenine-specific) n=2 Tax=Thermococcus cleftensis (strain DSM 27260 / KACC 17922 / CL1) TaxID=163003 RepID=I3ZU81_THECF|nr:hypothetical protein CL1_1062 [Thermococcus cleftensis]